MKKQISLERFFDEIKIGDLVKMDYAESSWFGMVAQINQEKKIKMFVFKFENLSFSAWNAIKRNYFTEFFNILPEFAFFKLNEMAHGEASTKTQD